MPKITYPETPRIDVVEEHFGHRIVDPYRWLEQDARGDRRVADWVAAQNAVTQGYLAALPGRNIFRNRLAALLDYEQFSIPIKRGGRYFFTRHSGQDNQPILIMRDGDSRDDRVLINPNVWSDDNADALAEWAVADGGRLVAYGVQTGGTDWRTIRVLDVDTSQVLDDEVQWARFTQIAWAKDASGFFYSRFPQSEGGATDIAGIVDHAVYFHALGTPQSEDRLVY
jgi:prolyl oligopeptidase